MGFEFETLGAIRLQTYTTGDGFTIIHTSDNESVRVLRSAGEILMRC